jgi:hypothetical protein
MLLKLILSLIFFPIKLILNLILLPVNLVLLPFRLLLKISILAKMKLWTTV